MPVSYVYRAPSDMAFTKETVQALKQAGIVFSKASTFNRARDYVVLNSSREPIHFGSNAKNVFLLNKPEDVHLSVSKNKMHEQVQKNPKIKVPETSFLPKGQQFVQAVMKIGLPAILKPNNGRRGEGAVVITNAGELMTKLWASGVTPVDYILQKYEDVHAEYRFHYINGEVVNVGRKIMPDEKEKYPGVFDGWVSLGQATSLHKRAHNMAKRVYECFPLGSVAIDILRCGNDPSEPYYRFGEINTGYGLGPMTATRLKSVLEKHYTQNLLSDHKVK